MYPKNEQVELIDFLHATINFCNLKDNWKFFGVGMVKNGCGQSSDGSLKLSVFEEWTDGINWFYACWYRFTKN